MSADQQAVAADITHAVIHKYQGDQATPVETQLGALKRILPIAADSPPTLLEVVDVTFEGDEVARAVPRQIRPANYRRGFLELLDDIENDPDTQEVSKKYRIARWGLRLYPLIRRLYPLVRRFVP